MVLKLLDHILGCRRTISSIQSILRLSIDPSQYLQRVSAHKTLRCRRDDLYIAVNVLPLVMTVTLDPLVPLPELGLVVRRVLPELAEGIDPGGQLGVYAPWPVGVLAPHIRRRGNSRGG